jgi:Tfp pilus assembly protein PilV
MTLRLGTGARSGSAALRRALRRRREAGYTAVEVLMSMAVLAVGVVGIIATEKITIASNLHAKNLAIATHIAEGWLGMLEAEGALWGSPPNEFGRTTWLAQGVPINGWFRPTYNSTIEFGSAFDALGNPVRAANLADAQFCVDVRLSPLTTNNTGGGLIRSEVRVIWLRNENAIGGVTATNACSIATASVTGGNESRLFHFVYMTGAVRQVGA